MASMIQVRVDDDLKAKSDELLKKLDVSREHAAQGLYKDADDVVHEMREKYGL